MSRLTTPRSGFGFHLVPDEPLFQVNIGDPTSADGMARILHTYIRNRLHEGMMDAAGDSAVVTFDYDDVFVMELLMDMAAACTRAANERAA